MATESGICKEPTLLSVKQVAIMAGVPRARVYWWIGRKKDGLLVRHEGRRIWIGSDELLRFAKKHVLAVDEKRFDTQKDLPENNSPCPRDERAGAQEREIPADGFRGKLGSNGQRQLRPTTRRLSAGVLFVPQWIV